MARKAKLFQTEPKHHGGIEQPMGSRKVATGYGPKKKHKGTSAKQGHSGVHKDAKK